MLLTGRLTIILKKEKKKEARVYYSFKDFPIIFSQIKVSEIFTPFHADEKQIVENDEPKMSTESK